MSRLTRAILALVVLVLLLGAFGCGGGAGGREKLFGKWDYNTSGDSYLWDFKKDGVLFIYQGSAKFETTYVFVDDDTITVVVPEENGENWTFDFKVEGDQLSLTANGVTQVLTAVKEK